MHCSEVLQLVALDEQSFGLCSGRLRLVNSCPGDGDFRFLDRDSD